MKSILKMLGFDYEEKTTTIVEHKSLQKAQPSKSHKAYPEDVLAIHHEFETASDKLVNEAYSIINSQPVVNESKLNRLAKFGFKQVKEVEEGSKILETTKLSKEQIELVQYYKQHYPFQKFITEEQVKAICHKYNLVCGDVDRFRGFVPDANLKDIENFKLKKAEKGNLLCKDSKTGDIFIIENAHIRVQGGYGHIYPGQDKLENKHWSQRAFQSTENRGVNNFYSDDEYNVFGLRHKGSIRFEVVNNILQICAPVKDMDISGLELKEGYKLFKKHIPDPVVLQPVKGGYLIITAWGDEASDPLVVNENFN